MEAAVSNSGRWFSIVVLVLAASFGGLFTIQNAERVSDLSLNLWVVAFQLQEPQPIPYLLWGAFGIGLLIAGALGSLQRLALQRRVRTLEQDVARASLRTSDDDWT